ncbi:SpoIIE family protein phosphatase [Streptomyces scopuliridis]|uniref:SpoIIE family protein phosphatase n=1 Tax=Streptomyces scopuliridis TaxID=452529 RepID=A0ACD4ZUP3_9ACTN|nr:SpoIIE family protein phosphatase [Streptomyces scopuliridis]WSC02114.1 SpoIIE family protein phosphatase [Streptomyces scopuliridis]WSC04349.1 SpoIIE family protein phosphatase [Streptomyces scopuliridis]
MDDTRGVASGEIRDISLGGERWATAAVDAEGVIARWSAGAEALLGYRPAEAVGRAVGALLSADPPDSARRALAGGEPWSGRIAAHHRDGGRREVELLAFPLRTGEEGTRWLLAAAAASRRPGQDEALMRRAFTESGVPIAIYGADLRLLRANEELCRVIGRTEDDMRALGTGFLPESRTNAEVQRALRKVLSTGEAVTARTFHRASAEKRDRAWALSLAPLKDPAGRVTAIVLTGFEITEEYWAREGLALLNEAGMRIGTTLDVTRTAQELASMPVPRFADFISVDLLDSVLRGDEPTPGPASGEVLMRRVAHCAHAREAPEAATRIGEVANYPEASPPARCLATGRAVLTGPWDPDYHAWMADRGRRGPLPDLGVHSLVAAPLVARGNTLGVALFSRRTHTTTFTEDDLTLAEQLVGRAAVCIDNARRYTRERGTAETLQRSLLPRGLSPQSAVEVATRYLPADSQYGVGGDWFDVIPLSGSRVALVVGDVVGHGIHASATMGRLRTAVRTLADIDLPPDELLTHLDDVVGRLASENTDPVSDEDIGASCLYAVYDPVSRRFCAARAGHPPPALATPDGTVSLLELPGGPPLGLGDLPFESAEFEIPEGSTLVLYTDGLIENRTHDITSSIDGLCEILTHPSPSLESTCDTVLRTLLSPRPEDDVALLVARTRALDASQVVTWNLPAEPALVSDARDHAITQLATWGLEELTFTTELVISELFTNAILHAEGPVQLRLIRDRALTCEVSDTSTTAPHLRRARVYDEGGRGLLLVAQLTDRWGTRQIPSGKAIWAELALPTG